MLHDSLGVVARFRPLAPRWGSAPFHYVLSKAGAGVVAAERGDDPAAAERRWSTGRKLALAGSRRLAHTVGVNGFYAALAGEARSSADAELVRWLTEWECARACRSTGPFVTTALRPDGWLLWREGGEQVEAFLEYDRGTDTLGALAAKLRGYAELEGERGVAAWVLFAFESARREATARRALADATVAVATAAPGRGGAPGGRGVAAPALVRPAAAARRALPRADACGGIGPGSQRPGAGLALRRRLLRRGRARGRPAVLSRPRPLRPAAVTRPSTAANRPTASSVGGSQDVGMGGRQGPAGDVSPASAAPRLTPAHSPEPRRRERRRARTTAAGSVPVDHGRARRRSRPLGRALAPGRVERSRPRAARRAGGRAPALWRYSALCDDRERGWAVAVVLGRSLSVRCGLSRPSGAPLSTTTPPQTPERSATGRPPIARRRETTPLRCDPDQGQVRRHLERRGRVSRRKSS